MSAPEDTSVRTPEDARRWAEDGTRLFLDAAKDLTDAALDEPTGLPGWTRRHVVSHVAANADALGNLVAWAATGEPTPMYPSAAARAEGIERGLQLPSADLIAWLEDGAARLGSSMRQLTADQWFAEVVTAQGRTVPATEIPWLRAREVFVHSVDLSRGVGFADLPRDFLESLQADVLAKRGDVPEVDGELAEQVAWLTGRPHRLVGVQDLGAWI